jgi:hypothetical protein
MYKYLALTVTLLITIPLTAHAQLPAKPPEGADYKVITIKSPRDGKPVHLLVCNNGTTQCTYNGNNCAKPEKCRTPTL